MRTPADADLMKTCKAAEQYLEWRCTDIPSVYRSLMPVSTSAKVMYEGEQRVRALIERDYAEHISNPWWHVGPLPTLMDFTDCPELSRFAKIDASDDFGHIEMRQHPGLKFEIHPEIQEVQDPCQDVERFATATVIRATIIALRQVELTLKVYRSNNQPEWKIKALELCIARMTESLQKGMQHVMGEAPAIPRPDFSDESRQEAGPKLAE